jgi:hypothetical protein
MSVGERLGELDNLFAEIGLEPTTVRNAADKDDATEQKWDEKTANKLGVLERVSQSREMTSVIDDVLNSSAN